MHSTSQAMPMMHGLSKFTKTSELALCTYPQPKAMGKAPGGELPPLDAKGGFKRPDSAFRDVVSKGGEYPPEGSACVHT